MRLTIRVLTLVALVLLGLAAPPLLAQTPDDFDINFEGLTFTQRAVRRNGEEHIVVTFPKGTIADQWLLRVADKTGSIGPCSARMEVFQKVLPKRAPRKYVEGSQKFPGFPGVFLQPTILVGRSLPHPQPDAAPAGGNWAIRRLANVGWTLPRAGAACIYPNNPADRPTIGPWDDGPSLESYRVFPYVLPDGVSGAHAIVSVDAPAMYNIRLLRPLGIDPGPPSSSFAWETTGL